MKWFSKSVSSILLSLGIGIFFYILCLFTLPQTTVFAQSQNWRFSSFGAEFDAADTGEVNAGAYGDRVNRGLLVSTGCMVMPVYPLCTTDQNKALNMVQGSVLGKVTGVIASTFNNPPASTYAFVQDLGQTLGFMPKQTYAQGIGFGGMAPLLPIWKAFRNIAYALLALVMIVIGFMVMLRKKIDPKTVVTVQNALPRIVITLLLITFSYAIVGIMIDLMYLVILLLLSLMNSTGVLPGPDWLNQLFGTTTNQQLYTQGNLFMNLANIQVSPWQIFGLNAPGVGGLIPLLSSAVIGSILVVAGAASASFALTAAGAIVGIGVPLVYALMSLMMIFLFIRLAILFIGAYIQIVLALVVSPLQILMEAIPGSTSFSSWFKNLLANIVVFPIGAAFFMLSNVFSGFAQSGTALWAPPYVGVINNPVSMHAILSLGILFAIPTVAGSVKEAIKAKPAVNVGAGGIPGQVASGAMQLWQLYTSKRTMDAFSNMGKGRKPS